MMTITRDEHGRFAKVPAEPVIVSKLSGLHGAWADTPAGEPLGIDISQLLNIPEVAAVAGPGESLPLSEYVAGPHEVLVMFWPFLKNGGDGYTKGKWQMSGPGLFRINTKAKRDDPRSVYEVGIKDGRYQDHGNHWSFVARIMEQYWLSHMYITHNGICRGDASFLPDPFACALELRVFIVQTWSGAYGGPGRDANAYFWKPKIDAFFNAFPYAKYVLVPSTKPDVPVSGVYPLSREMAQRYIDGTNTEWVLPSAEVVVSA